MDPNDFREPFRAESQPTSGESAENPYIATLTEAEVCDTRPAEITGLTLPHQHIGWSALWVLVFWLFQVGVGFVAVIGLILIAAAQGRALGEIMESLDELTVVLIPIGTLASVFFAALAAWLFYRPNFIRRLAIRGMSVTQWVAVLLSVLPMAVLASEVTNWASKVLPQLAPDTLVDFASSPLALVLVSACLFPAVGEEIFCRGFLGRGLVAHHGPFVGVFLASLLFGIMHIEPVQATGAFVLGIGLHFVYLTTRSLVAPVLIHLLNNAFAFVLIRNYETYPMPGLTPDIEGNLVHTPPLMVLFSVVAVMGLGTILIQARTRWMLPDGSEWTPGYSTAEQPPKDQAAVAAYSSPHPALLLLTPIVYGRLLSVMFLAYQSAIDQIP